MTAPALVSATPRLVDITAIERELAQLWNDPDQPADQQDTVTRACMSNLLIYCDCDAAARQVPAGLAQIAQRHPSRVLLLVGTAPDLQQPIEAYVSALCHPVAGGRQVCSEHVTIRAHDEGRRRLASVARSLLIGDLPTALWWSAATAPAAAGDPFPELVAMTRWFTQHRENFLVSDLNWRRLRPWRRALGETVDPAVSPGLLSGLRELKIHFGHRALPLAWLLAGWVTRSLGLSVEAAQSLPDGRFTWGGRGRGGPVRWELVPLADRQGLVSVELAGTAAGRTCRLKLESGQAAALDVVPLEPAGPARRHVWPDLSTAELVALELPELGADPTLTSAMLGVEAMLDRLRQK